LDQALKEADAALEEERNGSQMELQEALRQNESDMATALDIAEEAKKGAIKEALAHAQKLCTKLMEEKDHEVRETCRIEKEESMKRCKEETTLHVSRAVDLEQKKLADVMASIAAMRSKHEEETLHLQQMNDITKKDMERLMMSKMKESESALSKQVEKEAEKVGNLGLFSWYLQFVTHVFVHHYTAATRI